MELRVDFDNRKQDSSLSLQLFTFKELRMNFMFSKWLKRKYFVTN